jgi:glutathione S-transferase
MIDLYAAATPNVWKVSILIEELGRDYSIADIANWSLVQTYPWPGISVDGLDHLQRRLAAIAARPAVRKGVTIPPRGYPERTVEAAKSILAWFVIPAKAGTPGREVPAVSMRPRLSPG